METLPPPAVILAAGASSRMGRTKQLLPIRGAAMLQRVIESVLAFPFERVTAVVGHDEQRIRAAIAPDDARFRWIVSEDYRQGLSASLKAAVRDCPSHAPGIMVFLGDQPLIERATIGKTIEAVRDPDLARDAVVQPTYRKRPGHPVYLPAVLFPRLLELTGDNGAMPVIRQAARRVLVPVDDPGIAADIDTPEDYREAVERIGKATAESEGTP